MAEVIPFKPGNIRNIPQPRRIPKPPEGYYIQYFNRTVLAVSIDYAPMVLLQDRSWRQLDDLSNGKIKLWDYGKYIN